MLEISVRMIICGSCGRGRSRQMVRSYGFVEPKGPAVPILSVVARSIRGTRHNTGARHRVLACETNRLASVPKGNVQSFARQLSFCAKGPTQGKAGTMFRSGCH